MSKITLPFTRPWDVRIPITVRYLEKKFIDDFFEDGSLMLSSFHKFRKHKSNQLGDPSEGLISMQIQGEKSQDAVALVDGSCSFVLSTSTIESKEIMVELEPSYEDGFRINDSVAFAHAVASKLPEFSGGFQGDCIYRNDLVVRRNNTPDFPFQPPNSEEEAEKYMEDHQRYIEQQNNLESFFLKALKYSNQNEYRFVWRTTLSEIRQDILIKCPEARNFCERLGYD